MSQRVLVLLYLVAGETAERYVARLLADTAAVYLARPDRTEVELWLRRPGIG